MDTEMVQIPRKALEKIEWQYTIVGNVSLYICPACGREKEMQKGHKDDCPIGIALKTTYIEQKTDKPTEQRTMELDGDKFVTVIQKEDMVCKGCFFLRDMSCALPPFRSISRSSYYGCEACSYIDRKSRIWVKAEEKI